MVAIDVIIPSYRLQSKYLLPILQMDIPAEASIRFLLIADNPKAEIPNDLHPFIDNKKVILFRNPENRGVCKTRNTGINNALGEWLLFLDDDVIPSKNLLATYLDAIKENPDGVGFFGDVIFPPPTNSFTNGIKASDMLTLFSVPVQNGKRKWSPTANVIIKRSAIGDIRFNEIFAKAGAGEEIDFFLRIYKNTRRELQGIKNAQVYHDWWYEGKRVYARFFRWNTGIAILPGFFPEYAFYTFPNAVECLTFGLPLVLFECLFLHSLLLLVCLFIGIISGECLIEFLHLLRTKGLAQSKYAIEVVLIRAANDIGRLTKLIQYPSGICRRFNSSCDVKNIATRRFWGGLKFIAYILFSLTFYLVISYSKFSR